MIWPRMRRGADGYWITVDGKVVTPVLDKRLADVKRRQLLKAGVDLDVKIVGGHTLTGRA